MIGITTIVSLVLIKYGLDVAYELFVPEKEKKKFKKK